MGLASFEMQRKLLSNSERRSKGTDVNDRNDSINSPVYDQEEIVFDTENRRDVVDFKTAG